MAATLNFPCFNSDGTLSPGMEAYQGTCGVRCDRMKEGCSIQGRYVEIGGLLCALGLLIIPRTAHPNLAALLEKGTVAFGAASIFVAGGKCIGSWEDAVTCKIAREDCTDSANGKKWTAKPLITTTADVCLWVARTLTIIIAVQKLGIFQLGEHAARMQSAITISLFAATFLYLYNAGDKLKDKTNDRATQLSFAASLLEAAALAMIWASSFSVAVQIAFTCVAITSECVNLCDTHYSKPKGYLPR